MISREVCFVLNESPSVIYKEIEENFYKVRDATWDYLTEQEFQLTYYGRFGFKDIQEMGALERNRYYELLVGYKEKENEASTPKTKGANANAGRRR